MCVYLPSSVVGAQPGSLFEAAGCPLFPPPAWVTSTPDSQPQPGEQRAEDTQEAKAEGKNSFQFQNPEEEQTRDLNRHESRLLEHTELYSSLRGGCELSEVPWLSPSHTTQ